MRQTCVVCRVERTVPAWDRSWQPPARWRLVAPADGFMAGRLMAPIEPIPDGELVSGPIRIDAWSDVACPWCYIGKRNLEAGIAAYRASGGERGVEVVYRSFELAPDTPVDFDGTELDYLARIKGIGRAEAQAMLDRVAGIAAGVGLRFDFGSVRHTRTVKAHQLLHLARARGVQAEMAERLFSAYFVEGRHIGRNEELADLAERTGLDPAEVLRLLEDGEHLADVEADQERARAYGIRGVPFYVLDERYALSGAHPPEAFAAAIRQVADELELASA